MMKKDDDFEENRVISFERWESFVVYSLNMKLMMMMMMMMIVISCWNIHLVYQASWTL